MSNNIRYKTFSSSEEFETWQDENPQFGVVNVQPMVSGIEVSSDMQNSASAYTSITVFVTYMNK